MIRETFRRNWAVDVLAVTVLVTVLAFASYAEERQHLADDRQHQADVRAERQRQAICAILANIPGHVPAEIARARTVFARPGHPVDCNPIRNGVIPKSTPVQVFINGRPAEIVVNPTPSPAPTVTRTVAPSSRPTPTSHPTPSPSRTPSRTPSPSPSPSRSCLLILCR